MYSSFSLYIPCTYIYTTLQYISDRKTQVKHTAAIIMTSLITL